MTRVTMSTLRQPMHLEPADMEVQRTAEKRDKAQHQPHGKAREINHIPIPAIHCETSSRLGRNNSIKRSASLGVSNTLSSSRRHRRESACCEIASSAFLSARS